jgi:acetaldehyde dehydrogenase (acetylating)
MEKRKIKAGIIGPGNIGIDLMIKLSRSELIQVTKMMGTREGSTGLKMAREMGIEGSAEGANALTADDGIEIVFDASSAKGHMESSKIIKALGKYAVDLTPAAIGPYLVPAVGSMNVNLTVDNYNMVTCGGQATIPIVAAINRVEPVIYGEIVATIASLSAGKGTRANIDEFTQTTADAIVKVGGAKAGKAIIILNPAEPPLLMQDTIYAMVEHVDKEKIIASVEEMVRTVQQYVPGYRMIVPPIFDDNKVTVMVQIEGAGDYLPKYSGNLDIMTSAAKAVGEQLATQLLNREIGGAK